MTPQQSAKSALIALQRGEVARVMGFSSTPAQIRAKADDDHKHLYSLAQRIESLAAKASARPNRRGSRKPKRTSRRRR